MSKLLIVFLLTALIAGSARGAEGLLPAPYQVEGVVQYRSDHQRLDDGLGLAKPLVMVDLGDAQRRPHPGSRNVPEMTFIGTAGSAFGRLEDIAKSCAFLCGDDAEQCHYVARYAIDRPLAALGTPLVGLVGRHDVDGFAPLLAASAGATIGPFATELLPPVWSPHAGDDRPTGSAGGIRRRAHSPSTCATAGRRSLPLRPRTAPSGGPAPSPA